jgi:diadenosine tetraphosphate (Ap4A) HIT family hydrolase
MNKPCPFCDVDPEKIRDESEYAAAIRDVFPITEGHSLVVPRRHVPSIYDLEPGEQVDLWGLVALVRQSLLEQFRPDGFTIGVNDGAAAGQTVPHAHVHVVPRRSGDVGDPRGGLRWVVPDKARYWEDRA